MKTKQNIKKQTRKVGVSGSFQNQIMGNNSSIPKVGEGATILYYSDRSAYEVLDVSEDGNSCVIRKMDCKFIGKSYGDERYEYLSNNEAPKSTLEWNDKRKCWGWVSHEVQIFKSIQKKYYKEYGYGWMDIFLNENGLTHNDLIDGEDRGAYTKLKLIKGITKEYKEFNKVSVIFGMMEEYRDPHF